MGRSSLLAENSIPGSFVGMLLTSQWRKRLFGGREKRPLGGRALTLRWVERWSRGVLRPLQVLTSIPHLLERDAEGSFRSPPGEARPHALPDQKPGECKTEDFGERCRGRGEAAASIHPFPNKQTFHPSPIRPGYQSWRDVRGWDESYFSGPVEHASHLWDTRRCISTVH